MADPLVAGGPDGELSRVDAPTLTGTSCRLRAIVPEDYEFLYHVATHEDLGFRWRFGGQLGSPESFVHDLWRGVFTACLAETPDGAPVGHLVCYDADLANGFGFVAAAYVEEVRKSTVTLESLALFVDYLFAIRPFRKLYADSVEFNFAELGSTTQELFTIEGRFAAEQFYAGRYWDVFRLAIFRETWEGHPLVERLRARTRAVPGTQETGDP
jgi:RimJ/RimL family protein N-acetyltransferase